MKRLSVKSEVVGLDEFIGKSVCIFCGVYIYTGTLVGIGTAAVKLETASIVYETGALTDDAWRQAERLPDPYWWVSLGAIESFGPGKSGKRS